MKMNSEFIDEVKNLVDSVSGFLCNYDGNDVCYIEAMNRDFSEKARETPELQNWAIRQLADFREKLHVQLPD
jgi:hypothetical protein